MTEKNLKTKEDYSWLIHTIIGIGLVFIVTYLLGPVPYLTDSGKQLLGVLIATLYLWNTLNTTWTNLFVVLAIGFTSFMTMNEALGSYWGKAMIMQFFFMMLLMMTLVANDIPRYISRVLITRKFIQGKPFLFIFILYVVAYFAAMLIGPFAPIFLLWPMCYEIFALTDYDNSEAFPKILLIGIVICALMGFASPIYMSYPLGLASNFALITSQIGNPMTIPSSSYIIMAVLMSLIIIFLMTLVNVYIFRPSFDKFENFDYELINKEGIPTLSLKQKILCIVFILYVLLMLLPNLFPNLPFMDFLTSITPAMAMIASVVLMIIHVDGEPVLEFTKISQNFAWDMFLRICSAFMLGGAITNPETGIGEFINNMIIPLFDGMSLLTFGIVLLIIVFIATNLFNCLIISMLVQPVIISYAMNIGIDPTGLIALMMFYSLSAAALFPGSSPFGSVLFANPEWISKNNIYKYVPVYLLIISLVTIFIGFPLINILF